MRRSILMACVVAFLIALLPAAAWAATIPEPPYTTAAACLACHEQANDGPVIHETSFTVPPVDHAACNTCHWLSGHPSHGSGGNCAQCHPAWPSAGSIPWISSVQTPYGWFNSAASAASTDAAYLHQVHARRGWAADVTSRSWGCGSCHAPAACTACHTDVPHDAHPTQNGNPAPAAPYAATAKGAPVGAASFPALDTFGFVSCAAADCHGGIGAERVTEDSDPSVAALSGWTRRTPAQAGFPLLGGTALYANAAGSSLTVPFTGNQVSVWGVTGIYGGGAQFWVDGVYRDTKSFYEMGVFPTNGIWMSGDVGPGAHTLRVVVVTGTSPYGNDVYFDRIVARDLVAAANITPTCLTCHVVRQAEHGYTAFDHTADETATSDPALSGKTCGACHSMDLSTAHELKGGCEVCHAPVSAGSTVTAEGTINADHTPGRWGQTCEACHNAGNPVLKADKHAGLAAHETAAVAADAECLACHGAASSALPAIHASAETTIDAGGIATHLAGCDVCHANPTLTRPLSNVCSSCHFTMDEHPGADHTSAYPMNDCAASGCHTSVNVVASTGTTEDLVAIHNDFRTFACAECHGSTSPNAALYRAAIAAGDKDCTACHDDPGDHVAVHVLDPQLVDAAGPHYAYGTGSAPGGTYTEDCALCHTSNLVTEHMGGAGRTPRYRPDGTALGCADCHASTDLKVQLTIQKGSAAAPDLASCDDCHISAGGTPIHQQMSQVHLSRFSGGTAEGTADLAAVHAPVTAAPPGGGTALNGCAVCHGYFTSFDTPASGMGTRTQTAIAAGVATCSACHTPDMIGAKHVAPGSAACTKCHTKSVTALHAASKLGGCSVCHSNPNDPDKVAGMTNADCAQSGCHTTAGIDYHTRMDARHGSPTNSTCFGTGCHDASRDLRQVHTGYAGAGAEFSQYADACEMCHLDPRIDWTKPVSGGCVDRCHTSNHTGMRAKHATTSASDACTPCHGADIVSTHDAYYPNLANCARCHADPKANWNRSVDCATCHDAEFPPQSAHYSDATHTATPFAAASQGATVAAGGEECAGCHSPILAAAHSTAATGGAQLSCVGCHTDTRVASPAVVAAGWPTKTCVACHDKAPAGATTHAGYGTAHVVAANGCAGSGTGCHASTDLAVLHAKSRNGGVPSSNSCYNADPSDPTACHVAKDQRPAAFPVANSCGTGSTGCHQDKGPGTHGAHTLDVGASAYSNTTVDGCTGSGAGCHLTETRATPSYENPYHPANGCASSACHTSSSFASHAGTLACQDCHDGTFVSAPDVKTLTAVTSAGGHYGEATHTAAAADRTGTVGSGGTVSALCTDCHADAPASGLKGIYSQHQGLPAAYGDTTCADCHDYSAGVSAVVKANWKNDACADCHNATAMPGLVQHAATAPIVTGSSADGCGAGGTGCHSTYDLHALHKGRAGGKVDTCALSGCHDYTKQGLKPTGKTCGTGGACHNSGDPHTRHLPGATSASCITAGCHDKSKVGIPAAGGDLMVLHAARTEGKCAVCHANPAKGDLASGKTTFDCQQSGCHGDVTANHKTMHDTTGVVDAGCRGCHFGNLVDEHNALGYTCDTCHRSTNSAVIAAIAGSSLACDGCHPAVNGKDRHANQDDNEFVVENSSMHRVYSALPGSKTSFLVNGRTYTWSLPSNFLKAGWTTSSLVTCDDCHTFSATAAGPHGASVAVNIDPAYPSEWSTARLSATRSGSSLIICDKCHQNIRTFNKVHDTGDHDDYACNQCHAGVPHGWRLPRLLAYATDPAPYRTVSNGLEQIALKSYSPSGWTESDCYAGCAGDHDRTVSTVWPSTTNTVGTLRGTVKDASGIALSGASITTDDGRTGTTDPSGGFTFTGIPTGAYAVTVAKTGYATQTKTATVTKNVTTTLDFTLAKDSSVDAARDKTASATSQYSSTYAAAKAVDGLTNTWWRSNSTGNQNLTVDLGGVYDLNRALVNWNGSYYARAYTIQVSTDNSAWTTVANATTNSSGTDAHSFVARARYIRLACTSANSSSYQVIEFEAWGVAVPTGTVSGTVTSGGSPLSGATVSGDGLSTTTDGSGNYTFGGLLEGTYTLTASKTGYVTSAAQTVAVIGGSSTDADFALAAVPVSTNAALAGAFTASSQYSSSYGGERAGDGSYSTDWRSHGLSYSSPTEWLQVDLGSAKAIGRIVVGWNGTSYYARAYQVQYASSASGPWTTIPNGSVTSGTSSNRTFTLATPVTARYWRVNCTSYNSSSGYRLYEFETWTP